MDIGVFAALLASAAAGWSVCRRRLVYALGPEGPALAPGFLIIVWLGAFWLGQAWGSLAGMAWTGAGVMAGLAVLAAGRKLRRRWRPPATALDIFAAGFLAVYLLALPMRDSVVHNWIIGAFCRGNIPPSAINDPAVPLAYHAVFTAAAAVFAQGCNLSPEIAVDMVSLVLLSVLLPVLGALSRIYFRGPWAGQAARIFFLFGFGPAYLWPRPLDQPYWFLHGATSQSFAEAVSRPPAMLGLFLFAWIAAALAPRLPSPGRPERGGRSAAHAAFLLPALLILPHASEETAFFAVLALVRFAAAGRLPAGWALLGAVAAAVSFMATGTFQAFRDPAAAQALPRLTLAWPPILPSWAGELPLLSGRALARLLREWGPIYFGTWFLLRGDSRRRVGVELFLAGLVPACLLTTGARWGANPDLDRFLFPGTAFGFFLAAVWVERLEQAAAHGRLSRRMAAAALALLFAATTAGPLGCLAFRTAKLRDSLRRLPGGLFRATKPWLSGLEAVGPRDLVLTDQRMAPILVQAGFVVAAPMNSNMLGEIDAEAFTAHVANLKRAPAWALLPRHDPRAAGKRPAAALGNYLLLKVP
ncbi:MAG: hypothetical protein PHF00_06650 [Elusimicrobia bacterium]|nr:hypothetical protein [Elusimicrobiota bacterium]